MSQNKQLFFLGVQGVSFFVFFFLGGGVFRVSQNKPVIFWWVFRVSQNKPLFFRGGGWFFRVSQNVFVLLLGGFCWVSQNESVFLWFRRDTKRTCVGFRARKSTHMRSRPPKWGGFNLVPQAKRGTRHQNKTDA